VGRLEVLEPVLPQVHTVLLEMLVQAEKNYSYRFESLSQTDSVLEKITFFSSINQPSKHCLISRTESI
jgi:hypothetical protein